ncbi:MAG: hypothetical protein H8D94_00970 [Candidatus Pelagibacter sp.]|nr:hypothetical protein [Candidatus Pelagibacter sp.]
MDRKRKNKIYFGMDVQEAIIKYNLSENDSERSKIYANDIQYAFDKLAENIINTFKFTYFDMPFIDIKHEVVAFLVMNIHKYDHTRGSKAFSYFSVVAKNYLILHNNANYKRLKTHEQLDTVIGSEKFKTDTDDGYTIDFLKELIKYFESNIQIIFKKPRDVNIAYSIVELLKHRDEIENFNKKSLYILIREMTDVNTAHITKVMNVFKIHYKKVLNEFDKYGIVGMNDSSKQFF